jgi:hypothetical protein
MSTAPMSSRARLWRATVGVIDGRNYFHVVLKEPPIPPYNAFLRTLLKSIVHAALPLSIHSIHGYQSHQASVGSTCELAESWELDQTFVAEQEVVAEQAHWRPCLQHCFGSWLVGATRVAR